MQKRQSIVGRWRVGGGLYGLLGLWLILGFFSSSVLGSYMSVLTNGSETMIRREKERSRVRAVQMNTLRGLLGIKRTDKVLNARIRQLWSDEGCE